MTNISRAMWFFGILLIASTLFFLFIRNHELNNRINALRARLPNLTENDLAPSIELLGINGERELVDFGHGGVKHLLYILANSCNPCERNMPVWKRLAHQVKDKARVISIVLGGQRQAQSLRGNLDLESAIYFPGENSNFAKLYRVTNASQTLIIDEQGRIKWVKSGDLRGDDYLEIKALIFD
jgi:hypothetical protein